MRRLHNRIREYAWGSHEFIASVQGRPVPSPVPEAELWVGAHPDNPSTIEGGGPLDSVIAAAPGDLLGAAALAQFGPQLPYLLKLLAASRSLSIQAHPDRAQAEQGYAAEDAAGVPHGSPERSYVDRNHKPELLVACTEFDALCGFRPPEDSAKLLDALDLRALRPVCELLSAQDLRGAVRTLLTWPREGRAELVADVAAAAGQLPEREAALVAQLVRDSPGDVGVLVALLLNHITLRPGEAIWMPAGNMHAYLRGAGVEVMAASDNVLRGGLTPKHVNVPELLRVLRFEPLDRPLTEAAPVGPGVVTWPVPVPDFRMHAITLDAGTPVARLDVAGPRTVLCLSGSVAVRDGAGEVELGGGEAAFGGAGGGTLTFSGAGLAYLVSL